MLRRSGLERRTVREWCVRATLASIAIAIGYISMTNSLAEVVKRSDLERAHLIAPKNGRITALVAEKRFLNHPDLGGQAKTRQLAQLALAQDPMAVSAVATLGFQAQLRNDTVAARRLFTYSQLLSRRDLQTQIWAIEDAVARGDVPTALRHYDIALRTTKSAPDLLFPVLAKAIAEPNVRQNLARMLAEKPGWGPQFVTYLANSGGDPDATARFFVELHRVGTVLPSEAVASSVGSLVANGSFDAAWQFYSAVRPGVDRKLSRDPRFSADFTTPSAFDWTPVNDAVVSTSIQRNGRSGIFEFSVPAGAGGTVLKQLQMLPSGGYRFEGHSVGIDQPDQSLPYWIMTCQDGRELGRVSVTRSTEVGGIFAGRFNIPAGCPVQTLALVISASDGIMGSTGQFDRIRLFPAV